MIRYGSFTNSVSVEIFARHALDELPDDVIVKASEAWESALVGKVRVGALQIVICPQFRTGSRAASVSENRAP